MGKSKWERVRFTKKKKSRNQVKGTKFEKLILGFTENSRDQI